MTQKEAESGALHIADMYVCDHSLSWVGRGFAKMKDVATRIKVQTFEAPSLGCTKNGSNTCGLEFADPLFYFIMVQLLFFLKVDSNHHICTKKMAHPATQVVSIHIDVDALFWYQKRAEIEKGLHEVFPGETRCQRQYANHKAQIGVVHSGHCMADSCLGGADCLKVSSDTILG